MPLSAPRDTPMVDGDFRSIGVAANAVIYAGALVCQNAAGFAVPGATAANLVALGRAEESVVGGATNGAVAVRVRTGNFRFRNSGGGDAITIANRGSDCFVVDDEQVALTNGGNTRSRAGVIHDVDAQGVWVRIGRRA
jgi:hypothetical protein